MIYCVAVGAAVSLIGCTVAPLPAVSHTANRTHYLSPFHKLRVVLSHPGNRVVANRDRELPHLRRIGIRHEPYSLIAGDISLLSKCVERRHDLCAGADRLAERLDDPKVVLVA